MSACLLALLALLPAVQDPGPDEIVRLRDGRLVVGAILDHDLDGLEVESARTGGRFRLAWSDLFPGEDARLKRALGYRVDTVVPMVAADRLLLADGRQQTGRILRRDARGIELRVKETTVIVPVQRLASPPEKVMVPAIAILTPEQFYAERLPEVDGNDALAQFEFARELQAVFALEQARPHLERARELAAQDDDGALGRRVEGALAELEVTLANRSQAEVLEEIRHLIHRERFTQAEELLQHFGEEYPGSPLKGDWLDLRDRFGRERESSLEGYLARNWFNTVTALVRRKALDRESSMDSLMRWAEEELPDLVRERMAARLRGLYAGVDDSEVDGLWARRFEHHAQRFQASFGDGSWVLGPERARAGLDPQGEKKEDGRTRAEKEFEERVQRYLDSVNRARSKTSSDGLDTPEEWWRHAPPTERFQFLLAYYAEFSGDYEVTARRFDRCPICGGSGVISSIEMGAKGSQQRRQACPRCHQVGVRRAITFR